MKKLIFLFLFLMSPVMLFAQGAPNTFNPDFSINLPDTAQEVTDIQPLPDISASGLGSQIFVGAYSIPGQYKRFVMFGEIGFDKSGYHPYADAITKDEILSKAQLTIAKGETVYFFYNSSHPLHIQNTDGKLSDFNSPVIHTTQGADTPVYQYTFSTPGTYEYDNAFIPYQAGEIVVTTPPSSEVIVTSPIEQNASILQPEKKPTQSSQEIGVLPNFLEGSNSKIVSSDGSPMMCAQVYLPVCGKDGKTYGNDCEAKNAGITIDRQGQCGVVTPLLPAKIPLEKKATQKERTLMQLKNVSLNTALSSRLSGRILLNVEEKGSAWYINPVNKMRYALGHPDDAFRIMRKLGLGISDADLGKIALAGSMDSAMQSIDLTLSKRLAGRILLQVQGTGEAWYVNPVDLKRYYLGKPNDAFFLMRTLGLGITTTNLESIIMER